MDEFYGSDGEFDVQKLNERLHELLFVFKRRLDSL